VEYSDFSRGIDQLTATFNPRSWGQTQLDIYWGIFREWTAGRWSAAVARALADCEYMPKPAELRKFAGDGHEAHREDASDWPKGCGKCLGGFVYFEVKHRNGLMYERVLSCDCDAGDRATKHLLPTLRKKGIKNEAEVRYSVYAANHGMAGEVPDWVNERR